MKRTHFYVLQYRFVSPMTNDGGFVHNCHDEGCFFAGTIGEQRIAFPFVHYGGRVTIDLELQRPATMQSMASAELSRTEPL